MILACWLFQISFGLYIIVDALLDDKFKFEEAPELKVGLTRFICGIIMHMQCNEEFANGMLIMKYAINHHWKFSNYRMAFLPGFLQVLSMTLITFINY